MKEIKIEKEDNSYEEKGKDEEIIKVKEEIIEEEVVEKPCKKSLEDKPSKKSLEDKPSKQPLEDKPSKKSLDVDIDEELENIVTGTIKADVELANKKVWQFKKSLLFF